LPSLYNCPHCLKPIELLLPCEPLYSLETTAALLLTNVPALVELIRRHKAELSPPLYRTIRHRRMRFLPASDVRLLRGFLYSTRRWKGLRRLLQTPATRLSTTTSGPRPDR
jgi:hypothetical protein